MCFFYVFVFVFLCGPRDFVSSTHSTTRFICCHRAGANDGTLLGIQDITALAYSTSNVAVWEGVWLKAPLPFQRQLLEEKQRHKRQSQGLLLASDARPASSHVRNRKPRRDEARPLMAGLSIERPVQDVVTCERTRFDLRAGLLEAAS